MVATACEACACSSKSGDDGLRLLVFGHGVFVVGHGVLIGTVFRRLRFLGG